MPKTKTETAPTQKQLSRRLQLQRQKRLVQLGTAAVLILVSAVLAYGYWKINIQEPASPVAVVNGVPIRKADFETMLRYRRLAIDSLIQLLGLQLQGLNPSDPAQAQTFNFLQAEIQAAQLQLAVLDSTVLEEMVENQLLEQYAAHEGISASKEEIDRAIELQVGFDSQAPTPLPDTTPTPVISRAEFEARYRDFLGLLSASGISEEFYRGVIRQELLRGKIREVIIQEVPTTAPQVHARHILLATQEGAEQVLARLQGGEDFVALAQELSQDELTKNLGGDLEWFSLGEHDALFDGAAFALEVGEISEVVSTSFGFHIIQVLEKEDLRELAPRALERKREEAFRNWLAEEKAQADLQYFWAPDTIPLF